MPFDQGSFVELPTEAKPDLSKPSLEGISWILRNQIPVTHLWNFAHTLATPDDADFKGLSAGHTCGTVGCAIGLAVLQWPQDTHSWTTSWMKEFLIADAMGLPTETVRDIFLDCDTYGKDWDDISPTDVADAIDRYLASRK